MTSVNLDQKAAQCAQKIIKSTIHKTDEAKAVENLITKTLGVLQEQGVYAMILFLFSRTSKENEISPHIRKQLYELLQTLPAFTSVELPSAQETLDTLAIDDKKEQRKQFSTKQVAEAKLALSFYSDQVCQDLHILFMVKDLYEQTLIYARYGAKAKGKS